MTTHRIQLRGPWMVKGPADADQPPRRIPLPAPWREAVGDTIGTATFERTFHCPTNLAPSDQVWLVFTGVSGTGRVLVNGAHVAEIASRKQPEVRLDITGNLLPTNKLCVELTYEPSSHVAPGGLFGTVVLEIESTTA